MKKTLKKVIALCLASGLAAGSFASVYAADKKTPITMWFWGAATDYQETMKDVLAGWYNQSQDKYELQIEFRNTVDKDIPVALAAGNAPDIIYMSGPSYGSVYQEENLLLNLDDYSKEYGWQDRVLGVMYDACTLDGSLYSIPGGMCIGGLYYNKELFEEKGWNVPETWDDMLDLFEKADADGIYPLGAGNKGWKPSNDHFSSMVVNHYAGSDLFYDALMGNESFNNERMVEAINVSKEWYEKGYFSGQDYVNLDSQEYMQMLADKRCAMIMAPSLYTQFAAQSFLGDDAEKVGFAPMPSKWTDEDVYDVSLNCNFAINASTEYADECAKILDYMLSSEYAVKMTEGWPGYWTTPVKDVVDFDSSSMTGLAKMSIDAFQKAIPQIDAGYFALHPATFFPSATDTAFQDVDTVWQGIMDAETFCETVGMELNADIEAGRVCPLAKPEK